MDERESFDAESRRDEKRNHVRQALLPEPRRRLDAVERLG